MSDESGRTTKRFGLFGGASFIVATFAGAGVGTYLAVSGMGAIKVLAYSYGLAVAILAASWIAEEVTAHAC